MTTKTKVPEAEQMSEALLPPLVGSAILSFHQATRTVIKNSSIISVFSTFLNSHQEKVISRTPTMGQPVEDVQISMSSNMEIYLNLVVDKDGYEAIRLSGYELVPYEEFAADLLGEEEEDEAPKRGRRAKAVEVPATTRWVFSWRSSVIALDSSTFDLPTHPRTVEAANRSESNAMTLTNRYDNLQEAAEAYNQSLTENGLTEASLSSDEDLEGLTPSPQGITSNAEQDNSGVMATAQRAQMQRQKQLFTAYLARYNQWMNLLKLGEKDEDEDGADEELPLPIAFLPESLQELYDQSILPGDSSPEEALQQIVESIVQDIEGSFIAVM